GGQLWTIPDGGDVSAVRLGGSRGVERVEVGLPFPREHRLLLVVAVLAGGHHVGANGATSAHQRHHVIERQRARADLARAVVAAAGRDAAAPPRGLPQGPGAGPLAPEGIVVHLADVAVVGHRDSPDTSERRTERSSHSFISQATRSSVSRRAWAMPRARSPSR